jgi:hypothetical protein
LPLKHFDKSKGSAGEFQFLQMDYSFPSYLTEIPASLEDFDFLEKLSGVGVAPGMK